CAFGNLPNRGDQAEVVRRYSNVAADGDVARRLLDGHRLRACAAGARGDIKLRRVEPTRCAVADRRITGSVIAGRREFDRTSAKVRENWACRPHTNTNTAEAHRAAAGRD